jgi:predicted enzyme related to lactoylglutathione lyase
MERVIGIGGYFMRAADPAALGAWYRDCLGLDADENGLWRQEAGLTVFATFESGTGYFGSRAQQAMLNFRVRDLDAILAQLRSRGADVAKQTQDMEGVGRSAGSPIPRAIGSSCGSPPDRVVTQALTCWWPARLPGREPWAGPRGHGPFRLLRAVTRTPWRACHRTRAAAGGAM